MTLLENIKVFLSLVDEYAPDNPLLTEDDDIPTKVRWLYNPAYQEMADWKTNSKTKRIEVTASGSGYTEYSLPNCKQIRKIMCLDENNNKIAGDFFYSTDTKVYISNSTTATYIVEYVPFLTMITEDTSDNFELEIPQDLQAILPYLVASDLLKTDPSANWQAFEKVLQRKLQNLNTSRKGISVNITEGEL